MVILSLFNATPVKDIEAASQGVQATHSRYWTVKEMLNLALDAGFDTTQASNIVAIALAESGGFDGAQNYNPLICIVLTVALIEGYYNSTLAIIPKYQTLAPMMPDALSRKRTGYHMGVLCTMSGMPMSRRHTLLFLAFVLIP